MPSLEDMYRNALRQQGTSLGEIERPTRQQYEQLIRPMWSAAVAGPETPDPDELRQCYTDMQATHELTPGMLVQWKHKLRPAQHSLAEDTPAIVLRLLDTTDVEIGFLHSGRFRTSVEDRRRLCPYSEEQNKRT